MGMERLKTVVETILPARDLGASMPSDALAMNGLVARQRGFSLLEVLIAVLVLSIGLLGLAALQLTGLKQNQSALFRSHATFQAYQITDRMRANRENAENGDYNRDIGDAAPTGSTVADLDVSDWLSNLNSVLPAGDGAISINGDVVTVTVQWNDSRAGGGDTQQFSMNTVL